MANTAVFEIAKFDAPLGAEITGLDLRHELLAHEVETVLSAWYENQVLVIRDQDLTPKQLVDFTSQLGKPGRPRMTTQSVRDAVPGLEPEVMIVSNVRIDGKPLGVAHEGEMWFHSDMCYVEIPHIGTMLYAVELPSTGGNTLFADMYAAYDNLSPETRARLDGMKALHVYDYRLTERPDADPGLATAGSHVHPIFVTHPETGKKAVYVNRLMTARIEGMFPGESEEFLEELFAVAENPSIVYEHVWRPGDLVIWDNRCTTHARTDFPGDERRLLQRTTLVGTEAPR